MAALLNIGEFVYQIITPQYEKIAISTVANCFANYEPVSVYCKLKPKLLEEACLSVLDSYLGREVSMICIHKPSKTVCGTHLCHGYNPDGSNISFIPSDMHLKSEILTILSMLKFFDDMDDYFFHKYNIDRKKTLHQVFGGVDKR